MKYTKCCALAPIFYYNIAISTGVLATFIIPGILDIGIRDQQYTFYGVSYEVKGVVCP